MFFRPLRRPSPATDRPAGTRAMLVLSRRVRRAAAIPALVVMLAPGVALAQSATTGATESPQEDPALRFRLPTVTVTAEKEPEDTQKVPASVTAVSKDTL